jgi:mannose-6-phosphate isomerase-like protein (cupin superfamily)
MDYVRQVAFDELNAAADRYTQRLFDRDSGASTCQINCIKTPPGSGSPAGLHVHKVDQIFYILSGTMNIEVEGREYLAPSGSLVVFPKGVPHRNWNGGSEATVHLAFNVPLPEEGVPFAQPAG